ncbi:MAG: LrgB family protein [Neisseriaceae bacterium]
MNEELVSSGFLIGLTVVIYLISKRLALRYPRAIWLMPVIIAPLAVLFLLWVFSISLDTYDLGTRSLLWFLGPATAAFAVPIYEQRGLIKKNALILCIGVSVGVGINLLAILLWSQLFPLSEVMKKSMLAHSVSSPFAVVVSGHLEVEGNLAAILATFTGIFGMLVGELILAILQIKDARVRGIMYGTNFSAVGTAKAMSIGHTEGVLSSLSMVLSGLLMIVVAPVLAYFFK